ncbi:Tellurite methyltransferase [Lentibacillus sp. JNUCC-1]|uniref:methyltransferase domain-containing protein n=1 Tax=Lentibacillus sp. JNUCC-1 TaxID=2654513 RepID=UPI0012E74F11|nr:methyltransferase domain-containing protein [Lentibacillus sp. JNUCC-1]MUV36412.1 Tellurite methyltransferase [Lentibacillus sp. JNUCC-1]
MNARDKWNVKHEEILKDGTKLSPNERLVSWKDYLTGGTALDLAAGLGANSTFLTGLGYEVEAWDLSDVAVRHMQLLKSQQNLSVYPIITDLENINALPSRENNYDLVISTYYLDRSLFPFMTMSLKSGGYLFFETYYKTHDESSQTPINEKFLLKPNELLEIFRGWDILYFQMNEQTTQQTIFCRKP